MPADILMRAVSTTSSDPIKDIAGCHKVGDPVDVGSVGFFQGEEEIKTPANGGRFFTLTITDVTVNQVRKYLEPAIDGLEVPIRARLYRLVLSELPNAVKIQINTTGKYSATWAQVRNFFENKITLLREA